MIRRILLLVVIGMLAGGTPLDASTLFRSDPWEYHTDYSDYRQGCRVVKCSELRPERDPRMLTGWEEDGETHPRAPIVFADENLRDSFTLDLGSLRPVGKVYITTSLQDERRIPAKLTIHGSTQGPDGPWTTLLENGDMRCRFTYMFDAQPVRWLRFDLGENTNGLGSRIKKLEIYKRYKRPGLEELMKAFHPKFNRDCPGLEEFWKRIDAEDWKGAVRALRTYEEKRFQQETDMPAHYKRNADLAIEDKIDIGVRIMHFCQGMDWELQPDDATVGTGNGWLFGHLARAHSQTDDIRYSNKLVEALGSWIDQLPRPPDTQTSMYRQWATLVVSAQTAHFTQVISRMVKDREHFSDEMFINVIYSIWEHIDFLAHAGGEGGNWLAVVTRAVTGASMGWPEFADTENWLEFGKHYFTLNVMRDVYPDGKEFENSSKYVPFAYGVLLNTYNALKEAGVEIPRGVERRMSLGQDWSAWIRKPNNESFMVGDTEGGAGGAGLIRGVARIFDRDDLLYIATHGKEGQKPSSASRAFPISGWFVMRSDWEDGAWDQARHLLMTAAPYGPHGHMDQFSIYCYAYGNSLLSAPSRLGDSHYATAAHWEVMKTWSKNTVVVDGKTQPFGNEPGVERKCRNMEWFGGRYVDLADATHSVYEEVDHRRRVLFVRSDYWVVIDDLTPKPDSDANKTHTYDQHLHFRDGTNVVEMGNEAVRSNYGRGGNIILLPLEPQKLAASEMTSTPVNYPTMKAPTLYGWKYRLEGKGHQRFVTVLYPYPQGKVPQVTVRKLEAGPGVAAIEVATPGGRDIIYAGDGIESVRYSDAFNARARVLVVRLDDWGKPITASALDVEELNAGSYSYSAEGEARSSIEVDFRQGKAREFVSKEQL